MEVARDRSAMQVFVVDTLSRMSRRGIAQPKATRGCLLAAANTSLG